MEPLPNGSYIDGQWQGAGAGKRLAVTNPATEDVLGELRCATAQDLEHALAATQRAMLAWGETPGWDRSLKLRAISAEIRRQVESLATLLTHEQGKPLTESRSEVFAAADQFDWFADEARRVYGRTIPGRSHATELTVVHEAVGPVAAFTPSNFPWLLPARKVAAALAAGCPVVLKPAEDTPFSALALAHISHDVGLPPGALNVVVGDPVEITERLLASEIIRKVSFTGSVPIGQGLLRRCADTIKSSAMELGGHAPVIVLEDADPQAAASLAVRAKFRNGGQVCISPSRFFVAEPIAEQFTDEFVRQTAALVMGNGLDASTEVGPLASPRRLEAVDRLVADACRKGAKILVGGRRTTVAGRGYFYEPTVLVGVSVDMAVLQEEPFGPIAPILPYARLELAIEEANRLPYGLAGYVIGKDRILADQVSRSLEVGMVGINTFALATAEAPFGGVKHSGFGREGGSEGIHEYLTVKYISSHNEKTG